MTETNVRLTMAQWREEKGLSQWDVEKETGIHHTQISRVECGQTSLKAQSARRLMKFYGISPRHVQTVVWRGPKNPRSRDERTAHLRAELRGARRALRKAYDFISDDAAITFRYQDTRDALLPEIQRELRGS